MKEDRHEHRRAEHREEVLQGERNRLEERQPLLGGNGSLCHGNAPLEDSYTKEEFSTE